MKRKCLSSRYLVYIVIQIKEHKDNVFSHSVQSCQIKNSPRKSIDIPFESLSDLKNLIFKLLFELIEVF